MVYERVQSVILKQRIKERPAFINVIAGPRQVGKTTMVRQVLPDGHSTFIATDQPQRSQDTFSFQREENSLRIRSGSPSDSEWLIGEWKRARSQARLSEEGTNYILAIDEIQKIPRWSDIVKGLWDEDRAEELPLHVILLGSSPWLMQKGLTESLAGRYELIPMTHWSFAEMKAAFDFTLDEYIYFGGYPGSANLIRNEERWRAYIRGSLIHPNIEKDILQMTRVDKPALLKRLFELGCGVYSGQIIAYTKLLGQLHDAGNTTTLAHYLELLSQAGLLTGLPKYAGMKTRQRASSPKLNAQNTALISALSGYSFTEAKNDRSFWGRLVESAVGAHLINASDESTQLQYWRESPMEVDFVLTKGQRLLAIEVKSGRGYAKPKGLYAFCEKFRNAKRMIVGEGGVPLADFLLSPVDVWLEKGND